MNKRLLLGILGALIGAFIAAIPWILGYVFFNVIIMLLTIPIALGALKGYHIFKGETIKQLPLIIAIVSFFTIIITVLLIIPAILLYKEGLYVDYYNFNLLYSDDTFRNGVIQDLVISIIFTFIGISGVVSNLKIYVKSELNPDEEINLDNYNYQNVNNENILLIKEAFTKLNAFSKKTAVSKDKVLEKVIAPNSKKIFSSLQIQQIIKKYKGKYYFSLKAEQNYFVRFIGLFLKILILVIIINIIIILTIIM